MLKVAVVGSNGRLGAYACKLIEAEPHFELVASLHREPSLADSLQNTGAKVALDVTVAGLGAKHAEIMLREGLRPVIGTSGVTPAEVDALDQLAREFSLGGIVVPNFSLGVCLQQRLAELAVEHFPAVEIVETHHHKKRDAPSGTAADTARRLEARTGKPIPIHSLRLPGVLSNQELVFGGRGEMLRVVHETYSLEAFGAGILAALRYAATADGVALGLGAALWPDQNAN